jgi:hypothetical protein
MRGIETAAAALVPKIDATGGQALSADVADPVAGALVPRTAILRGRCALGPLCPPAVGRQSG